MGLAKSAERDRRRGWALRHPAAPPARRGSAGGSESCGWAVEVCPGVAEREPWGEHDRVAAAGWWVEGEVGFAVAGDGPAAVVELPVVEVAEQDAVVGQTYHRLKLPLL